MALINTDWTKELKQVEATVNAVVDNKLAPLIESSIRQAGDEMVKVVGQASDRLDDNIKTLSQEIHSQRTMTKETIESLIDYASKNIGILVDQKIELIKTETNVLLAEKINLIKRELEDAANKSRKTMYTNLALSIGAAVTMAIIGLIYKKISLGELDIFILFRVFIVSTAIGTGMYALLIKLNQWQSLNNMKKNAATVTLGYLGIIRPNGALGLFVLSLLLLVAWIGLTFFVH